MTNIAGVSNVWPTGQNCSQYLSVLMEYNVWHHYQTHHDKNKKLWKIAVSFVKTCMLKATEIACPNKWQAFSNINLTRNSIGQIGFQMLFKIWSQMKHKVICCLFSWNWRQHRYCRCCLTNHIHLWIDETLSVTENYLLKSLVGVLCRARFRSK